MAIEGIDSLIGRRRIDKIDPKKRSKADDFPLFYRTRESMIVDEAICASLRNLDAENGEDDGHSTTVKGKGKELTKEELNTIRTVVKDVDGMVQQLAFRESYFTCGVLNCLLISYVFGVYPQHFWLLYLIEMVFLIPINQYHRVNAKPLSKAFYYLDYCWIMNLVAVLSLVMLVVHFAVGIISKDFTILNDSVRKHLFMAVLGTSCGPLLAATAALPYIALLFHDIDTMTGLFIHVFPPMVAYQLRWHSDALRSAWPNIFHLNYLDAVSFLPLEKGLLPKIKNLQGTVAGNTLILYVIWFALYTFWMLLVGLDLPRKNRRIPPKFDTCFHSFMRGGACIAIGEALWKRPRLISLMQIEENDFERRDLFVHMIYHACTTLASIFGLGFICYYSKAMHGLCLALMSVIVVQRGARRYTYYSTSMFSRTLQKQFSILLLSSPTDEEVDEAEDLQCLDYQLRTRVIKLRTRIGLVPNYFITRGESISACSFEGICRKSFSWFLKLFQPVDFRDIDSYHDYVDVVTKLGQKGKDGATSTAKVKSILNQPIDQTGNTILHTLVKKRQLKFLKPLLLHCGEHIEINKRNARNQSSLDFAFDRLEIEMAFLLNLYGAKTSDGSAPNSLSYQEWIFIDLLANLDTGRWLNHRSIQAMMQHVMESRLPREELLAWAHGRNAALTDDVISMLGRLPQLFAITPADGCDAITNHEAWATLVRFLFSLHQMHNTYTDMNNLVEDESDAVPGLDDFPTPTPCDDLYGFLNEHGVDLSTQRVAGRTVFFKCSDSNNTEYAIKLSKTFEKEKQPHPLAKEAAMNSSMVILKAKHGLLSEYPSKSELITLTSLPDEVRQAIEGSLSKGYHPVEVSKKAEGITALLYCPPKGYSLYVNDPRISLQDCRAGILKGAYDYSVLARKGLFHGALVDIQHDSIREQRPHLWSFESFLTRFRGGAGRIDRGFAGLSTPNVRASGLGDLKHIMSKKQVTARYDPSVIHAQHNILYDHQERFQVSLIEQLGAGLFATALLIGSSWEGRHRQRIEPNLNLGKTLEEGFISFLQGYLQVNSERALELLKLMGTNFELMANQMKVFVTEEYVKAAESSPQRPIFGVMAKVIGFLTHPTALVHFSQWGGRDLSKPGYSLEEINSVYQLPADADGTRRLPEGYPRVDTSMMRCSPSWVKGHGWISDMGQPHFGSYEGVLPFQQLIRDLYAVVYLTSMILLSEVTEPPPSDSDAELLEGKDRARAQ